MNNDTTSPCVGELAKALSLAQGKMKNATRESINPFFKSHYADLATCWDALRPILSIHGLAVTQVTGCVADKNFLITILMHVSGEWIKGYYPLVPKDPTPQSLGSCITFAKRYALQAITGLASEDDDGNAASHGAQTMNRGQPLSSGNDATEKGAKRDVQVNPGGISQPQIKLLMAKADECGWSEEGVKEYLAKMGLKSRSQLNYIQLQKLMENMERFPKTGVKNES